MKNIIKCSVLIVASMVSFNTYAANCDCKNHVKIGVVNRGMLLQKSPQAISLQQRMKKEFDPRAQKLKNKETEIKAKIEKFQKDKDILAGEEKRKAERELGKLQQDYSLEAQEFQADIQVREQEEMRKFSDVVAKAISEVSKKEKIDLVVAEDTIMFRSDSISLTDKVIENLIAQSKSKK